MNIFKRLRHSAAGIAVALALGVAALAPSTAVITGASVAALAALSPTAAEATVLTDFAENKSIDALLRAQSLGAPATWYIGLDTTSCTETGGGTEVTGGSYARVSVTASLANWAGTQSAGSTVASSGTGGTSSNNGAITFPAPTANWGTINSVSFWDASSSGNRWICITLTAAKTVNNGDAAPSFAAAALSVQIDN